MRPIPTLCEKVPNHQTAITPAVAEARDNVDVTEDLQVQIVSREDKKGSEQ